MDFNGAKDMALQGLIAAGVGGLLVQLRGIKNSLISINTTLTGLMVKTKRNEEDIKDHGKKIDQITWKIRGVR